MRPLNPPISKLLQCWLLLLSLVWMCAPPGTGSSINGAGAQAPQCGMPDDHKVHIPPDWSTFKPPEAGQSYIDPVFGCQITRITNSMEEGVLADGNHVSLTHYYSTLTPVSADDSLLLVGSDSGAWRVMSATGKMVVPPDKMPAMNSGHPVWDASNGNAFYYARGSALEKGVVKDGSIKAVPVHTFAEYRGIVSPDAADLSEDGDHVALVGQNSDRTMDVFVWSLSKQAKTLKYTTHCTIGAWDVTATPQPGCVHKLLLTADNKLAIDFTNDGKGTEEGLRLWDGQSLSHLQDGTNHADTGYDDNGNSIFVEVGRASTLEGEANPCSSGWGLDVRQLAEPAKARCLLDHQPSWHVSYRGSASQPWAALSFFDDRKSGPEFFDKSQSFEPPSDANWQLYEDEIVLARIDGGAIFRLAQARSRSAVNYWATPRAAISRDGRYVVFDSNMAHPDGCPSKMHTPNDCSDVYLIRVR